MTVCVTGATGFVASTIVDLLLQRGYRVRGTVRDPGRPDKVGHLTRLPGAAERLDLVKADLLAAGSFAAAVDGCECVLHTASPYVLTVRDAQRDLVDPAVQGTLEVLEACARSASVKRVVLTSSVAAITDEPDSRHVLTEDDWNEKSSLTRNPYYYSKVLAEKAAWTFVRQEARRFDLVVINPFVVIGPSLSPGVNESNRIFVSMLTGGYPAIVSLAWGMVDVRDVALAHLEAMERPGASGRYLCANATMSMRETADLLRRSGYAAWKLPSLGLDNPAGNLMTRLYSYLQPSGEGSYLRTHLGRVPRFDNGKIRRELAIEFRPLETSVLETVADLQRWGHLAEPGGGGIRRRGAS